MTSRCAGFIDRFRLRSNAFTRQCAFPVPWLIAFVHNLRKGIAEQELAGFFATLQEEPVASAVPSRSAFSKARKGLSEKVFSCLNRLAIETSRGGWSTPLRHGFRLLAIDGTTLRLPPGEALAWAFGEQPSGPTFARGSVLYDYSGPRKSDSRLSLPRNRKGQ